MESSATESVPAAACRGIRVRDGAGCGVTTALSPSGYCLFHDPERREQAKEARQRGGLARRRRPPADESEEAVLSEEECIAAPESLEDAQRWYQWLPRMVATGKLEPNRSREVCRALDGFTRTIDKKRLQAKVTELEQLLKRAKKAERE